MAKNSKAADKLKKSLLAARQFGLRVPLTQWEKEKWRMMPPFHHFGNSTNHHYKEETNREE